MPAQFVRVIDRLPPGLDAARVEAAAEGYRFLDRLVREWDSGIHRFDRDGEALFAAEADGMMAAVGGITIDPVRPDRLRMRRFYVGPGYRRSGLGRSLALAILDHVRPTGRTVTVHAGTEMAPSFWEAMGFIPDDSDGHSHILPPARLEG